MSTGMSNLKEIKKALNILIKNGTKKKISQFCTVILNILQLIQN